MNFRDTMNFVNHDIIKLKFEVQELKNKVDLLNEINKKQQSQNHLLQFIASFLLQQITYKKDDVIIKQFLRDYVDKNKFNNTSVYEEFIFYKKFIDDAEKVNESLEEKKTILSKIWGKNK